MRGHPVAHGVGFLGPRRGTSRGVPGRCEGGARGGAEEWTERSWMDSSPSLTQTGGQSGLASRASGATDWLPVTSGGGPWNALSRQEQPLEPGEQGTPATRKFASVGYFETLGGAMAAGWTRESALRQSGLSRIRLIQKSRSGSLSRGLPDSHWSTISWYRMSSS